MQEVHRRHDLYRAFGIRSRIVHARRLHELEPNLRPNLAGALVVPGDSVIYAPRSAAALLTAALNRGAHLVRGDVRQLVPGGVQLSDNRVLSAQAVIVANGIGAVDLLPALPIRAKKGHLVITDRYPGYIGHQLVEVGYGASAHAASGDSVAFNVQPRGTGQLLIGSSRQFDVHSREVDHSILSAMLKRASAYLPGLGALSCIRVWTGLRAATADGLPFIGPHPARPGVWLASGHEGLGITAAPATAALLAAQIVGRSPAIPIAPYLPERVFQKAAYV
jgi:glycine/D-amino acid oxidase-like deaminating enzyme